MLCSCVKPFDSQIVSLTTLLVENCPQGTGEGMTPGLPGLVRFLHLEGCHLLQILDGKIQALLGLKQNDLSS